MKVSGHNIRKWLPLLLFLLPALAFAQDVRLDGFLQLDKRFNYGGGNVTMADFYNRFRLQVEASPGEQLYGFASADLRFYDFPRPNSLAGLEDLNQLFPAEASMWEVYVDVYGFLFPIFDLRIGKQRLSWGTADKLNPTDNLNPDDFSDLLSLGEKIPTWAVIGSLYLGDFVLTGVWLPSLTPALLPREGESPFLDGGASGLKDNLVLPAQRPENSMFAFKLEGSLGSLDFSLSYFNGYDDIPILRRANLDTGSLELGFPRLQVVGADLATELLGIGFWAEGAMFLAEKVVSQTISGAASYTAVELDDKLYFKFTIGADYTFPGGIYLNGQWMHGFFTERSSAGLNDYLFIRIEKKFFKDRIKIALGGGGEVDDWGAVDKSYGYGVFPELAYLAVDNLEIALGAFITGGERQTLLGSWQDAGQVYLRFKVNF